MEIKLVDNPMKLAEFLNNPENTGNIVDKGDIYVIKPDAQYLALMNILKLRTGLLVAPLTVTR